MARYRVIGSVFCFAIHGILAFLQETQTCRLRVNIPSISEVVAAPDDEVLRVIVFH